MPSVHSVFRSGRRALSRQLDRLRNTLDSLKERLRHAVAEAVGQSVGGTVRETFAAALSEQESHTPPSSYRDYSSSGGYWDDSSYNSSWQQSHDDYYSPHEEEPSPTPFAQPKQETQPSRWFAAVSTGCRAAAWWLRRCHSRWCAAGTVAIGLATTGAVYVGGTLIDCGCKLAELTDQVILLSKAARSSSS